MQTSTAFAPSPTAEDFAAFLAKLTEPAAKDAAHEAEDSFENGALAEEMAALSYEHALRAPVKKQVEPSPLKTGGAALVKDNPTISLLTAEKRKMRASICLTQSENALLHQRATENGLSVAAYVRACVFEVEALRAQVKQMMEQVHAASSRAEARTQFPPPKPAMAAEPEQPVLTAPEKQPALPEPASAPAQQRPRVPLMARPPQPRPATMTEASARLRAAIEAQKQLSLRERPAAPVRKSRGILRSIFGVRRSA